MPTISAPSIEFALANSNSNAAVAAGSTGLLALDISQLEASSKTLFPATGSHTIRLGAGRLSFASAAQIGRILDGVTITAEVVAKNQRILCELGAFCRTNGIGIIIEAQLANAPENDWTYQWLAPARQADLPIVAIENDDEAGNLFGGIENFAQRAIYMTAIVKQIVTVLPNAQIGQWLGEAPQIGQQWITTYNTAATAVNLPVISYIVADTCWNAPWVQSPDHWNNWLTDLVHIAQSGDLPIKVLLDGVKTAGSAAQWAAQSEQHAAMLATMGIPASTLLIEAWVPGGPSSTAGINISGTIANTATEIAATYTLYQAHQINAVKPIIIIGKSQAVVTVSGSSPVPVVSLEWKASELTTARAAAVLIDLTGKLAVTQAGTGTVSGSGTNVLVLNGTFKDLAVMLASLTIQEPVAGPDSLNIKVFGANGQLGDVTLDVIAVTKPITSTAQSIDFIAAADTQNWASASAALNADGTVKTLSTTWNTTDISATGARLITQAIAIHEPLARAGLVRVNGHLESPLSNPASGSPGSLPIGNAAFNMYAYDPSSSLFTVEVLKTTTNYDTTGHRQTVTNALAPSMTAPSIAGINLPNYFDTGGVQVTEFNTGGNPNWQPSWYSQLGSVTTTYGSSGQMIEQVFQGGVTNPWFALDNVFNPLTGALWEQFQTCAAPAPFVDFITGPKYVTLFNTGDNPEWDYNDWGSAPQVTITFQDYYAKSVTVAAPIRTGLSVTDAYGPSFAVTGLASQTNGSTLIGGNGTTTTGIPVSDVVTEYRETSSSGLVPILSGISMPILTLEGWSANVKSALAAATVFNGNDTIIEVSGNDTLDGYESNNIQALQTGSGQWIGGSGIDTAVLPYVFRQLHIVGSPLGSATVSGPGITDSLSAIDRLQFIDGTLYYDATSPAAEVTRMYQAALGRAPDPIGLSNWVAAINGGATLNQVAASFIGSVEFEMRFSSASQGGVGFVTQLYANVLHRSPDDAGLAAWVDALQRGTQTEAQELVGFSESAENRNNTAGSLTNGVWVADEKAASIARLYYSALNRAPDIAGLTNWVSALSAGSLNLHQTAETFANGAEFNLKYGNLSNADFVGQLYSNVLGRQPDPAGFTAWTTALNVDGMGRAGVLLDFSESLEHRGALQSKIEDSGIVFHA